MKVAHGWVVEFLLPVEDAEFYIASEDITGERLYGVAYKYKNIPVHWVLSPMFSKDIAEEICNVLTIRLLENQ